jgi:hypothetical protein
MEKKLHTEQLHNLYSSPNIISMIKARRWARIIAHIGEMKNMYKILFGKPEGGRPSRRWEDNIKLGFKGTEWEVWTGFICLRIGTCVRFHKIQGSLG